MIDSNVPSDSDIFDSNEIWKQHMYSLSNDIVGKLSMIGGYSQLLLMPEHGSLSEEQKTFVEVISRQVVACRYLIDSYLELAQVEASGGHENLEVVNISLCIEKAIASLTDRIRSKGQHLKILVPQLSNVWANEDYLIRIIWKLVENAHLYTPENGKLTIIAEELDDLIRIVVVDSGIGIEKQDYDIVFARLQRGRNTYVRGQIGIGLSLAIAKLFVERWGGRIGFKSEVGKGSEFWFTLPKLANSYPDHP